MGEREVGGERAAWRHVEWAGGGPAPKGQFGDDVNVEEAVWNTVLTSSSPPSGASADIVMW